MTPPRSPSNPPESTVPAGAAPRVAIVGTAGHIDHGKTALVRRLTGVDTDRLPEEKKRGISIDLGFAPLVTPAGVQVGLVDVPGHERFVKNMLAGAGGVDLVLLVVAADEGVMPQTREHLAIGEAAGRVARRDRADQGRPGGRGMAR
jgi:small GTP-binding protein